MYSVVEIYLESPGAITLDVEPNLLHGLNTLVGPSSTMGKVSSTGPVHLGF